MAEESTFSRGYSGGIFEFDGRMGEDIFDDMLLWCSRNKASEITVQSDLPVIAEIGGKIIKITSRSIKVPEVEGVVRYIYGENGPAEIKSGFDLDPSHEIKIPGGGRLRFRVNITGGRSIGGDGIQLSIRTLPEIPLDIRDLGIEQDIIDNFRPPKGMVLVTGPTGSGKSTLLSSGIRMILEQEEANEKMVEFSKPIEFVYDKVEMPSSTVFQSEVGSHLRPRGGNNHDEEGEFGYCVRNALRRKPSIILIGESRDKATIQASVEAALTGHVLYSTMHTIGVAETLRRAVMPFPGDERRAMAIDILDTLRMVVTQILLPREGGGMVGCREYLVFDDDVRRRLIDIDVDDWPKEIRKILEEGNCKGSSMADSAKKLLDKGEISEERYRYLSNRHVGDD